MASKANGFKPSGALKKFVDAGKKDSRVLTSVERELIAKPAPSDRASDVLHPSAMVKNDWCHRSSYFQLLGFPPPPSKYRVTLRQKRVFQTGHDIHAGWQTIFKDMEVLWGKWRCHECNDTFFGTPKEHDPTIGLQHFDYLEVPLVYDKLRIAGHADGILVGLGEPLMLEIKSIGAGTFRFEAPELTYKHNGEIEKMWKDLTAPFMSHIMQAQMYMKLAELIDLPYQPQEAIFIYENKATQEPKEFVVQKSDFGVTPILEAAAFIVDSVDKHEPPTCNINPTEGCYQCKGYEND